eukprot:TRINITY_DN4567_c0_g1_i1.p1 TRINITY_DN4567_c0_g1~~TRINITY_DN4567_c0_g1_i1.p1  ORF type:complete len:218 (+),score=70.02 TRINITY_DN4567_c0_g1_i1:204-857(+)
MIGKGQFSCGCKTCTERLGLHSYELPFSYKEAGDDKQALVKLRLCPKHAYQLNYRKEKDKRRAERREVKAQRQEAKKGKRQRGEGKEREDDDEESENEEGEQEKSEDSAVGSSEDDEAALERRRALGQEGTGHGKGDEQGGRSESARLSERESGRLKDDREGEAEDQRGTYREEIDKEKRGKRRRREHERRPEQEGSQLKKQPDEDKADDPFQGLFL